MSRILILSVTAGEGHNSAARAMKAYFEGAGCKCLVLDAYDSVSHLAKLVIEHGYLVSSSRLKTGFGVAYKIAEKRHGGKGKHSFQRTFHTRLAKRLAKPIADFAPDAILITHSLAGMMTDIIRRREWETHAKLIGVVTDFTMHPFWEECTCLDALVLPTDAIAEMAEKKGFDRSVLYGIGIPIEKKFAVCGDKREARLSLGLDGEKNTVLVMGGSMGHGHICRTVRSLDALDTDMQIVCVCGRNDRARKKVEALASSTRHKLTALGFVDYVDRLMDAADIVVSKPGGLSTSEALAKRVPLAVVDPIPGHERRNTAFLSAVGAALVATNQVDIGELVGRFFTDENCRRELLYAVDELRRPNSAADLGELTLRLIFEERTN